MTAAAYHAKLWAKNDPLKCYDMDSAVGPLYRRFGLSENAGGESYKDLVASLPTGSYMMNVDSPAGPNGHMFFVEIRSPGKGKSNYAIDKQDAANTQSWQPSDKILRYWTSS